MIDIINGDLGYPLIIIKGYIGGGVKLEDLQNLNETELDNIIQKIEESKPWSGIYNSFIFGVSKLYSSIIFTLLGLHISFIGMEKYFWEYQKYLFMIPFIILDAYFYYQRQNSHFNKTMDHATIAEWICYIQKIYNNAEERYNINNIFKLTFIKYITFISALTSLYVFYFSLNFELFYCVFMGYAFLSVMWYKHHEIINSIFDIDSASTSRFGGMSGFLPLGYPFVAMFLIPAMNPNIIEQIYFSFYNNNQYFMYNILCPMGYLVIPYSILHMIQLDHKVYKIFLISEKLRWEINL